MRLEAFCRRQASLRYCSTDQIASPVGINCVGMAYSNLANDGSLAQASSELWESSRYSPRMSADPDSLTHLLEKTEHQLPHLSLREMPLNRRRDVEDQRGGIQSLDVPVADSMSTDGSAAAPVNSKAVIRESELDECSDEKPSELNPKLDTPSWLSNALMRQQLPVVSVAEGGSAGVSGSWCSSCGSTDGTHCVCRQNMQMQVTTSPSLANHPYTDWLSPVPMGSAHPDANTSTEIPGSVVLGLQMESGSGSESSRSRINASNAAGGRHAHEGEGNHMPLSSQADRAKNWQEARMKAKLLSHPLFSQMLNAHVGCLRIATPVDQLPQIDEQLSRSQRQIDEYSVFVPAEGEDDDDKQELDEFMRNYTMILMNMQEQLEHHMRVHATEAMAACWELEQQLYSLTGVAPGPGTGATMSDDEDEQATESEGGGYDTGLDVADSTGGFGPLVPTETERSLMERVRQELKLELNEQGYRDKIVDVREEILRKRRAGKLPEGTTAVLKTWWSAHSKWPYPTEDEKERLIQETGLELKQVNNWFINQRKRNWHNNPLSSSSELKNKRKG